MTKNIQDLRREKGYRSAREFADALGISPSSMSRYDNQPDTIPTKVAWAMADALGCSIDEVVGRERVTSGTSPLQETYDGLTPETRSLVDEFMAFAVEKDARARRDQKEQEERRDESLCLYYERMFVQASYDGAPFGEPVAFVTPAEEREAFEGFLASEAEKKRASGIADHCEGLEEELRSGYVGADGERVAMSEEEIGRWLDEERASMEEEQARRDEEVIARIMAAHDRLHGRGRGSSFEYHLARMPE